MPATVDPAAQGDEGQRPGGADDDQGELAPAHRPLTLRRAVLRISIVAAFVAIVLGVGAVNGVGPLAQVTPPDHVTDPREMVARSLQTVIDASSVHVDAFISGRVPGALVRRADASVTLDGTQASLDLRPQDARSHLVFVSAPLDLGVESLTLWDTVAYRQGDRPWAKASLGSLVAGSGIDANPLTLVDRLRAWLAAPGAPVPSETDVACDAPSGRCRQVILGVGPAAGDVLLALFPSGSAAAVGPTTTQLLLQADVASLQPTHVVVVVRNATGTLEVVVRLDTSYWNWPSVIADPPG